MIETETEGGNNNRVDWNRDETEVGAEAEMREMEI